MSLAKIVRLINVLTVDFVNNPLQFIQKIGIKTKCVWITSAFSAVRANHGRVAAMSMRQGFARQIAYWNSVPLTYGDESVIRSAIRVLPSSPRLAERTNKPRRILYFLTNSLPYSHSGYAFRSHRISKALSAQGIDLDTVTRLGYPYSIGQLPLGDVDYVDGVRYGRLKFSTYPFSSRNQFKLAVKQLKNLVERKNYELIHCTTGYINAQVASTVARDVGIPWVYEMRGEPQNTWFGALDENERLSAANLQLHSLASELELEACRAAGAVIALSELAKIRLVTAGVEESKIFVAPNAVDVGIAFEAADRSSLRAQLGFSEGEVLVGTVTSVVEYEGLDRLLYAVSHLPSTATIVIVGDGTDLSRLKDLAARLRITKRVRFVGRVDNADVWKWYRILDVFVIPRLDLEVCRNVTPMKGMMAQLMGIPIVASDLPALREVTGDIETYVKPGDPISLAEAIINVSGRENCRGRKWAAGRTWGASAAKIVEAYDNCLGFHAS